jgi:hypothetical protein
MAFIYTSEVSLKITQSSHSNPCNYFHMIPSPHSFGAENPVIREAKCSAKHYRERSGGKL